MSCKHGKLLKLMPLSLSMALYPSYIFTLPMLPHFALLYRTPQFRRLVALGQYVFDRAIFSSLGKRMHQRHMASHGTRSSSSTLQSQRLQLLDWDVSTGCCNHDCHNALKWALRCQEPFEEHCKNLFLILDTLRHSFQYILEALPSFLRSRLKVRDHKAQDAAQLQEFWNAVGIAAETANVLADLDLWWDGDTLWVFPNQDIPEDYDLVAEVSQLILEVFHFQKCTASRWCSLGVSCRVLLASLNLGLAELMHIVRSNSSTSEYYTHNWSLLTQELLFFVAVAGLASFCTDALLYEMMEDDRLARRVSELEDCVAMEVNWVQQLPDLVWSRVQRSLGAECSATQLKSEVLQASLVAASYLHAKIFRVLGSLPWSLRPDSFLQQLAQTPQRDIEASPVASKIASLAQSGACLG